MAYAGKYQSRPPLIGLVKLKQQSTEENCRNVLWGVGTWRVKEGVPLHWAFILNGKVSEILYHLPKCHALFFRGSCYWGRTCLSWSTRTLQRAFPASVSCRPRRAPEPDVDKVYRIAILGWNCFKHVQKITGGGAIEISYTTAVIYLGWGTVSSTCTVVCSTFLLVCSFKSSMYKSGQGLVYNVLPAWHLRLRNHR